ncbi:hypothetical protein BDN72DRAFT_864065 [Pluteus cervinus]|uniref:Uncharacterized protein n=1 Tax=Pluteus cervinus TaxID=181527 RepID=A0ACD3A590_9AGAR|nr:hypothetical protein BDN72DRAFT_864065 [Pluteus cervinus]
MSPSIPPPSYQLTKLRGMRPPEVDNDERRANLAFGLCQPMRRRQLPSMTRRIASDEGITTTRLAKSRRVPHGYKHLQDTSVTLRGDRAIGWSLYAEVAVEDPAISSTLEESWAGSLANGFMYYMDERGGYFGAGCNLCLSAKAKGKEPEVSQPVVVSEDDFELVMGIFENVTHEKTEFLHWHHSLQTGMPFPAFTKYQDTFSNPLPPSMFASFTLPSSLPPPPSLLRIAKSGGGHRIIPNLNGNESDTLNESYICFRRREIKAVRKTRAQQVTSSDKLARLQAELNAPQVQCPSCPDPHTTNTSPMPAETEERLFESVEGFEHSGEQVLRVWELEMAKVSSTVSK